MAKGKAKEILLVGSKVKAYVKSKGLMCSSGIMEALNDAVYECLDKAIERAEQNGRKTAQARDV